MINLTKKQRATLFSKWLQDNQGMTYRQFRKTVQGTFSCDDCVIVKWSGMWLGIESDGYPHT